MQTHPENPVVNMPPMSPDGGASSTVLSVEVQSGPAPNVISTNVVLVCFSLVDVPIGLTAFAPPVGTPSGPVLTMLVGLADGRGVSVGEGVLPGVGVGGVGVKDGVGDGGAALEITVEWREKA